MEVETYLLPSETFAMLPAVDRTWQGRNNVDLVSRPIIVLIPRLTDVEVIAPSTEIAGKTNRSLAVKYGGPICHLVSCSVADH